MNLDEIFKSNQCRLTSLEEKISTYILENKQIIFDSTISTLSKELNVSTSMVDKTLNKLGINGFKQLKILLQKDLVTAELYKNTETQNNNETTEELIYIKTLRDTFSNIKKSSIGELVNDISRYRQVIVFGEGFMGILALDFEKRFKKIQKNVISAKHFEELKYINRSNETLFILLSVSGTTDTLKKVIDFAEFNFKSKKIVAITSTQRFDWKQNVDIHLFGNYVTLMPSFEKEVPCTSRFVVQYILDLVFIDFFFRNQKTNLDYIQKGSKIF